MIIKLDNRAAALTYHDRTDGPPCWEYVDGIKTIRCLGWVQWSDGETAVPPALQGFPLHVRGFLGGTGETAGGYVHEVEWNDGTTSYYWLNVPDAFLMNDHGATIDRLATGGGVVTPLPAPPAAGSSTWLMHEGTTGAADTRVTMV